MNEQLDARLLRKILYVITGTSEPSQGVHADLSAKVYLQMIRDAYLGTTTTHYGDLDEKVYLQQIRDAILGNSISDERGDLSQVVYLQQIRDAILGQTTLHYGSLEENVYLKAILNAVQHTYYVNFSGGLDSRTGKMPITAWKTITKINTFALVPGDRILFKRGETWSGIQLVASCDQLTFSAYGSGALPVLDGSGLVNCFTVNNHSYITLQNLYAYQGFEFGFVLGGVATHDNLLLDCDASNCGNDNVSMMSACWNITVTGGHFHDAFDRLGLGASISGIEIADGCHDILIYGAESYSQQSAGSGMTVHNHPTPTDMPYNITVKNCIFHDNTGFGWKAHNAVAAPMAQKNIVVDGCTSYNNTLDGMWIGVVGAVTDFVSGVTITNNFVYANARIGMSFKVNNLLCHHNRVVTSAATNQCTYLDGCANVSYWNNTHFTDHVTNTACMVLSGATTTNVSVKNNIFDGNGVATNPFMLQTTATCGTVGLDIDYNVYGYTGANNRWTWIGANKTWVLWLAASGMDVHSVRGAPLFTNVATYDFTLQTGSPAINAGVDVGLPYSGVAPDCGALEKA